METKKCASLLSEYLVLLLSLLDIFDSSVLLSFSSFFEEPSFIVDFVSTPESVPSIGLDAFLI